MSTIGWWLYKIVRYRHVIYYRFRDGKISECENVAVYFPVFITHVMTCVKNRNQSRVSISEDAQHLIDRKYVRGTY